MKLGFRKLVQYLSNDYGDDIGRGKNNVAKHRHKHKLRRRLRVFVQRDLDEEESEVVEHVFNRSLKDKPTKL